MGQRNGKNSELKWMSLISDRNILSNAIIIVPSSHIVTNYLSASVIQWLNQYSTVDVISQWIYISYSKFLGGNS